jgi:hypothetical protein
VIIATIRRQRLIEGLVCKPRATAGNGADGITFYLADYDGTTLFGVNDEGRTLSAGFDASTTFRLAKLDKYAPTDPYWTACRAAASDYDAALTVVTGDQTRHRSMRVETRA